MTGKAQDRVDLGTKVMSVWDGRGRRYSREVFVHMASCCSDGLGLVWQQSLPRQAGAHSTYQFNNAMCVAHRQIITLI